MLRIDPGPRDDGEPARLRILDVENRELLVQDVTNGRFWVWDLNGSLQAPLAEGTHPEWGVACVLRIP
ncbi:MAG: hypothetical protein AAFQ77_01665 [Myxococcota bacterium]